MDADLESLLSLSEHKKSLLVHHDIRTAAQFLNHPSKSLQNIMKVKIEEIERIKSQIVFVPISGDEYLQDLLARGQTISSGIPQIDRLFTSGGINSNEIVEIIGAPASGKTMLLYTIMVNVLRENQDIEVMFIDTKSDFQARKLQNMMNEQEIAQGLQKSILKRIRVERARDPESLIQALNAIVMAPKAFEKIKIVMIDSLSVPFYLYMGCAMLSLKKMTKVIDLMHRLTKNHVAVSSLK
jgi:RecA/RadA recombinase